MIRMPIDLVLDSFCISLLKLHYTGDQSYLKPLKEYADEFDSYSYKDRQFIDEVGAELLVVHNNIWQTEASIRQAKEDEMGLAEVGRRALIVRDLNRERQTVRARLIDYFKQGVKDVKTNYVGGKS